MFFAVAASVVGVKNLSPTKIQAIGYINIPNELQLQFGLSISLVVEKNNIKIRQLLITMVNIFLL